ALASYHRLVAQHPRRLRTAHQEIRGSHFHWILDRGHRPPIGWQAVHLKPSPQTPLQSWNLLQHPAREGTQRVRLQDATPEKPELTLRERLDRAHNEDA